MVLGPEGPERAMSPRGKAEGQCPGCSVAGTEYSPHPGEPGEAWVGSSRGGADPTTVHPRFSPRGFEGILGPERAGVIRWDKVIS